MKRMILAGGMIAALACVFPARGAADAPAVPAPATRPADDRQAALDKKFADLLTNATLVGAYSKGDDLASYQDKYSIVKAVKGEGDLWVITAVMKFRGVEMPVAIPVPVKWADDTPVISLTNFAVPGMGTFSTRIVFYGNGYGGTWAHGDRDGLMWGRIEHGTPATQPATPQGRRGRGG